MDDSPHNNQEPHLFMGILLLMLLLVVILLSVYVIIHCWGNFYIVCARYCICSRSATLCGCFCCKLDFEAYRRERQTLRRLRELRRLHRLQTWHNHHPAAVGATHDGSRPTPLSTTTTTTATLTTTTTAAQTETSHGVPDMTTFSQIPGLIPSHRISPSSRGGRPEQHFLATTTFSQIPGPIPNLLHTSRNHIHQSPLDFVLVSAARHPSAATHATTVNTRAFATSKEQRRAILERLLVCTTYHRPRSDSGNVEDESEEGEKMNAVEEGTAQEMSQRQAPVQQHDGNDGDGNDSTANDENDSAVVHSYAFPLHEEPVSPESTCAICLDDFVEGEFINDASKCQHVFHRTCLLEWLDKHDVCPCCRRAMITNDEWRRVAAQVVAGGSGGMVHLVPAANIPAGEVSDISYGVVRSLSADPGRLDGDGDLDSSPG